MNDDYVLQAIHEVLNQKCMAITNSSIQEIVLETLNDLIRNDDLKNINMFLEVLHKSVTESTANTLLLNTLLHTIIKTRNKLAIDMVNKFYLNIGYDEFVDILRIHKVWSFKGIIVKNIDIYLNRLLMEDRTNLILFICDDLQFFIEKYGIRELIEMFYVSFNKDDIETLMNDTIKVNHNHSIVQLICSVMVNIKKMRNFGVIQYDFLMQMINETMNHVQDKTFILKSIIILHEINFYCYLRNKTMIVTFNDDIYEFLTRELGKDIALTKNYDTIIKCSAFNPGLLKELHKAIIIKYNANREDHFKHLASCILFTHGFDFLYNIVRSTIFEFKDYFEIFKKINNADLSSFLELYADYSEENVFSLLPAFMNFCTDKSKNIKTIITLIRRHLINMTDDFHWRVKARHISLGISNLISSHLRLRDSTILLRNVISKEESFDMINQIATSDLLPLLINIYVKHGSIEIEKAVKSILLIYDQTNIQKDTQKLFSLIETMNESDNINLEKGAILPAIDNIYSLISVGELLISLIEPDSGLIAKILSLIHTKNNKLQKYAYMFLYKLIVLKKCTICICDTLISNDYQNTFTCSFKARLLTLFACYQNCAHCQKKNTTFFQKTVFELILTLKGNSSKARKIGFEILEDYITNENYHEYLKIILIGLNTDNYKIINGSISALNFLIVYRKEAILKNRDLIIKTSVDLSQKGKECHKNIIELYKNIILEIENVDQNAFIDLIDNFIQRKNLHGFLRMAIRELKEKNVEISSGMKELLNLKFKKRYRIDMTVTKKGIVELVEVGNTECDDSEE